MKDFFNRKRLSIILTILAFVIWSCSLLESNLIIDNLGLLSSYPVWFFIAIGILIAAASIAWSKPEGNGWLLSIQTGLFVASLFLTPLIIEGTTRFPASYQSYGFIDYVIRSNHINPTQVWYHSWPGFSLVFTPLFQLTGISNPEVFMGMFPFIIQLAFLMPLYLLIKELSPGYDRLFWPAAWVFTITNWTNQEYFSPQALAFLMLMYVAVLTVVSLKRSSDNQVLSVLIVLILFAITLTHLVTAIFALLIILVFQIIWRKINLNIDIVLSVVIAGWTIYGSSMQLDNQLPKFIQEAFQGDLFLFYIYDSRFAYTSPEHALINYIRLIYSAILLLPTAAGLVLFKGKSWFSKSNLTLLGIALCPVIMLPAFIYSGELLIRLWLVWTIPIACFSCRLVGNRIGKYVFPAMVVILVPFFFVSHYGNELIEHTPRQDMTFSFYLYDSAKEQSRVIALTPPVTYMNYEKYKNVVANKAFVTANPDLENVDRYEILRTLLPSSPVNYCAFGDRLESFAKYTMSDISQLEEAEEWVRTSNNYNLIFQSSTIRLYSWETH